MLQEIAASRDACSYQTTDIYDPPAVDPAELSDKVNGAGIEKNNVQGVGVDQAPSLQLA